MSNVNEPAFPESHAAKIGDCEESHSTGGLTKREYFAAKAMQGMFASKGAGVWGRDEVELFRRSEGRACVRIAEVLIEELNINDTTSEESQG